MIDELLLLSGNDLPFPKARVTIHQPRLKEIAYITEKRFWSGCELLNFDKEFLSNEVKTDLSNMSNFNIIMTLIQEKSLQAQQARLNVTSILALIFPTYEILLDKTILLRNSQTRQISEINDENFKIFKQILVKMFCLTNQENKEYNPSGSLAKKIANKLRSGQQQRSKLDESEKSFSIFNRYVSILAVGQQKDINVLMNYTVYQLMDEFNRFMLKLHYDSWERFRAAGATGMEDPKDWLDDIHKKQ